MSLAANGKQVKESRKCICVNDLGILHGTTLALETDPDRSWQLKALVISKGEKVRDHPMNFYQLVLSNAGPGERRLLRKKKILLKVLVVKLHMPEE